MDSTRLRTAARRFHLSLPAPLFRLGGTVAASPLGVKDPTLRRIFREQVIIDHAVEDGGRDRRTADTTERVVEIPWVMRRAMIRSGRVLDIGTANALDVYKRLLRRIPADELHLVDLAPFEESGAVSHQADIRALPFEAGFFDTALCISTLEHIGLDNTEYFDADQNRLDESGDLAALAELRRVTKPDGRILVTVPGGRAGRYGWYRQYDSSTWLSLVNRAGLEIDEIEYFAHDPDDGWRAVEPAEIEEREWGIGAPCAAGLICASLRP